MSNAKPHRIRVKVLDGKPRERNKLKGQLVPHADVVDAKDKIEFVICAVKEGHLDQVRAKLAAAGLEEVVGGDTTVSMPDPRPALAQTSSPRGGSSRKSARRSTGPDLRKKPYGFVPLPDALTTAPPVWHDGTGTDGRLSGEVRCELETLTPLLVGWERRQIDDADEPWPVPHSAAAGGDLQAFVQRAARQAHPDANDHRRQQAVEQARSEYANRVIAQIVDVAMDGVGRTIASKSILCPLRAPWDERPVILPGDSIKGLLRHELGALLGAPMERVAERSYSYRPNLKYPDQPAGRSLEPRLARVRKATTIQVLDQTWPFPAEIDVLSMAMRNQQSYYPRRERDPATNRSRVVDPPAGAEAYRGGLGGGHRLPDGVLSADARRRLIHTHVDVGALTVEEAGALVSDVLAKQYCRTLEHLLDPESGHFSARHPNVGTDQTTQRTATAAVRTAAGGAFQPGDIIWVEWDTRSKRIVSLGWHYYYRWAYTDSVRGRREGTRKRKKGGFERHGLFPLDKERECDKKRECDKGQEGDDNWAPVELSAVRRLFGYALDKENEGTAGIGKGDHSQLMGRVAVNAAVEVIEEGETRFLPPTFLPELGMPRPSAVEHYLEQPHHPNQRPSDRASLVTYGDAAGYDAPGKLAGRKFYLDREDAYTKEPWKDESEEANRLNDRSTLALEASHPGRRFRFTVRFRDLGPEELASVLLALCPHQFREDVGGAYGDGYCSKLGYARPLGWGTVRIEAKELHLLKQDGGSPRLDRVPDIRAWFRQHFKATTSLGAWLDVHRHKHPDATDYPRKNGEIYSFHTTLRADHTRWRRYEREGSFMNALLVLTAGQTDVQLVVEGGRTEFKKDRCARLHAELERRENDWRIVDAPDPKRPDDVEALPSGAFNLCTPKLDAVLDDLDGKGVGLTHALILETRRDPEAERGDPRAAGLVLARRLRERLGEGVEIQRTAILQGVERLEDRGDPRDAVVRREVVARLDEAVREAMKKIADGRVVVATTGGMPVIATLVEDVVRLYAVASTSVELVEVADGAKADPPTRDRAVARRSLPEPAESYRARRHALDLIEGGNLLGAWGAARHLHGDEVEHGWTRVVEWLSHFAASLPIPPECDVPLLQHPRMAVWAALRVEFALRAGDIPRAVHGTVAFFEAALWEHINPHVTERSKDTKGRVIFRLLSEPPDELCRASDGINAFKSAPAPTSGASGGWYYVEDSDRASRKLADNYLKTPALTALCNAVSGVRELRNDVAHNEPTPKVMDDARTQMRGARLWSDTDTFLSQPLVQAVLRELGEERPNHLCDDLVSMIRSRLLDARP